MRVFMLGLGPHLPCLRMVRVNFFGGTAMVLQQGGQSFGLFENLGLQAYGYSPKELNSDTRISFILYLSVKKWAMAWYKWGLLFMKI
jgi:hypothetical protein